MNSLSDEAIFCVSFSVCVALIILGITIINVVEALKDKPTTAEPCKCQAEGGRLYV
jgi:hypothetical protein